MNEKMEKIRAFCDAREWSSKEQMYELLLNMGEEISEMWSLVRWVPMEKKIALTQEKHVDVEDFVGDMMFLLLKFSYLYGVDPDKATQDVLDEYEGRFPIETTKGRHSNVEAGGVDNKYS